MRSIYIRLSVGIIFPLPMLIIRCAFLVLSAVLLSSCIGEDIVQDFVSPELRIENPLQSLGLDESYQFEALYLNNVGKPEPVEVRWFSEDTSVLSIDELTGTAIALSRGQAVVVANTLTESPVTTFINLQITDETVSLNPEISGSITSSGSYRLTGDFSLRQSSQGSLELLLADNYEASSSLPGLYVYLTNNPNSINGAIEIGRVIVFNGAHSYDLPAGVSQTDYNYLLYWCKPFSVKVGGGTIN